MVELDTKNVQHFKGFEGFNFSRFWQCHEKRFLCATFSVRGCWKDSGGYWLLGKLFVDRCSLVLRSLIRIVSQPATITAKRTTINQQRSTISAKRTTINQQRSTICYFNFIL